jgi:hypothetical protein
MSDTKFTSVPEYYSHIAKQQTNRTEAKPVVHFYALPMGLSEVKEGYRIRVVPFDHPAEYLNGQIVTTSPVVKANEDGSFETLNTLYVPKLDK